MSTEHLLLSQVCMDFPTDIRAIGDTAKSFPHTFAAQALPSIVEENSIVCRRTFEEQGASFTEIRPKPVFNFVTEGYQTLFVSFPLNPYQSLFHKYLGQFKINSFTYPEAA